MALRTTSDNHEYKTSSTDFKKEFLETATSTGDKKQVKESIFRLAQRMKEEGGDCKVIQGWADDLRKEIKESEAKVAAIRKQGTQLEYISEEKYFDFKIARYEFMEMNEGDEDYYNSKLNVDEKEHEYRVSHSKVTSNSIDEYSELCTKRDKSFDLWKLESYINFFKRAINQIFRH